MYNAIAAQYDSYHPLWYEVEDEITRQFVKCNGNVLDVGCGTGFAVELFNLSVNQYLGIDIATGMLDQAQINHPRHNFICQDARRYVSKVKFDTILFMFGGASYLRPAEIESIIRRNLQPKGKAYFHLYGQNRDWNSISAKLDRAKCARLLFNDELPSCFPIYNSIKINPWNRILPFVPNRLRRPLLKFNPQWLKDKYYAWTLFEYRII